MCSFFASFAMFTEYFPLCVAVNRASHTDWSIAKPLLPIFMMICYPFLIVEFYLLISYEEFLHLQSWKYWKKRHTILKYLTNNNLDYYSCKGKGTRGLGKAKLNYAFILNGAGELKRAPFPIWLCHLEKCRFVPMA